MSNPINSTYTPPKDATDRFRPPAEIRAAIHWRLREREIIRLAESIHNRGGLTWEEAEKLARETVEAEEMTR